MKLNLVPLFIITLVLFYCVNSKNENPADGIIDKAIEVSGGDIFSNSIIDFDFRNRHYKAFRNNGLFEFEREFQDTLGTFKDVLSNSGYERFLNNEPYQVHDTMSVKYARSINSVHYFSILPYGLNDESVNKTYLEKVTIKDQEYHKIKVTFSENGGGEDYDDVFLYYINTNSSKLDYFSYLYYVDGGGIRFREAYNERYVKGLRFVDYKNFKPEQEDADLNILDSLYQIEELKLLSKIELENISVKQLYNAY